MGSLKENTIDFLVQKYLPNVPNSDKGGWADVALQKGLLATDALKAAQQAGIAGRLRVIRWDYCEEYTTTAGPVVATKVTKIAPVL